jgi:hypothetical protein
MSMSALGWELPLDAICANGSYAQEAGFAKSDPVPDSGPSSSVRRMTGENPNCLMLHDARMSAIVREPNTSTTAWVL